jgi:hypothetical protein
MNWRRPVRKVLISLSNYLSVRCDGSNAIIGIDADGLAVRSSFG